MKPKSRLMWACSLEITDRQQVFTSLPSKKRLCEFCGWRSEQGKVLMKDRKCKPIRVRITEVGGERG